MRPDLAARFDARMVFAVQQLIGSWSGVERRKGRHRLLRLPWGGSRFSPVLHAWTIAPRSVRPARRRPCCCSPEGDRHILQSIMSTAGFAPRGRSRYREA
jgi:hypothetical protein